MKQEVNNLLERYSTSRRHFLRASAIAGGLMAAGQMTPMGIAGFSLGRAAAQEGGDVGVLNYALTLEHFENALYRTLIGSGLAEDNQVQDYLEYYGSQEAAHVEFLTAALKEAGATPVSEQDSYDFPELSSQAEMIDTLITVEDLGASAYLGGVGLIENDEYLVAAIRIHSTEAFHATGFRLLSVAYSNGTFADSVFPDFGTPQNAFAVGTPPEKVLDIVADFGVMPGMPSTGAGGASRSNSLNLFGVAGLGAAAAAGLGYARTRGAREVE